MRKNQKPRKNKETGIEQDELTPKACKWVTTGPELTIIISNIKAQAK